MVPSLRDWHARYSPQGLVIIAVHSPEFFWEKDPDRVRAKVADLKIRYPVALDNDFRNWKRYGNRYWPTRYLVDKRGRIRARHIGEGGDDEVEAALDDVTFHVPRGQFVFLTGASGAGRLPDPLVAAGMALTGGSGEERARLVETWLEDPAGPEPVLGFWVRVAAAPILEAARASITTPSR